MARKGRSRNGDRGDDLPEMRDVRVEVSRYVVDRLARTGGPTTDETGNTGAKTDETKTDGAKTHGAETVEADTVEDETDAAGQTTMDQRAQYVEIAIQQAIRRGDFDNLRGAGKPLDGLTGTHDPNWWIRQKIEREQLTGLGPPALTLRTENAALDARMDAAPSERAVRELLTEFNARVIEARRQLQGGPPVITPPRDIEAEVALWQERRQTRYRALSEARERQAAEVAAMSWRERRRLRKGR